SVHAGHKPNLNWVDRYREDDWNRCSRRFCRQRRRRAAGGDNHGDLPANEIGSKGRQSIVSGFCPTIFDLNVLALNVSYLFQSLPKRAQTVGVRVRRGAAKETDYRPLLHARVVSGHAAAVPTITLMNSLRLIASPRGSRQGIVSAQTSTLEGGGHALRGRTSLR